MPCGKKATFSRLYEKKRGYSAPAPGRLLSHMQTNTIFNLNETLIPFLQVSRCGIGSTFRHQGENWTRICGNKEMYPHWEAFTGLDRHRPARTQGPPLGSRHTRLTIRHEISLSEPFVFHSPRSTGRRSVGATWQLPAFLLWVYRFGN
jgi:hypothetical protein